MTPVKAILFIIFVAFLFWAVSNPEVYKATGAITNGISNGLIETSNSKGEPNLAGLILHGLVLGGLVVITCLLLDAVLEKPTPEEKKTVA